MNEYIRHFAEVFDFDYTSFSINIGCEIITVTTFSCNEKMAEFGIQFIREFKNSGRQSLEVEGYQFFSFPNKIEDVQYVFCIGIRPKKLVMIGVESYIVSYANLLSLSFHMRGSPFSSINIMNRFQQLIKQTKHMRFTECNKDDFPDIPQNTIEPIAYNFPDIGVSDVISKTNDLLFRENSKAILTISRGIKTFIGENIIILNDDASQFKGKCHDLCFDLKFNKSFIEVVSKSVGIWIFDAKSHVIIESLDNNQKIRKVSDITQIIDPSYHNLFYQYLNSTSLSSQNREILVVSSSKTEFKEIIFSDLSENTGVIISVEVGKIDGDNSSYMDATEMIDLTLSHDEIIRWFFNENDGETIILDSVPSFQQTLKITYGLIRHNVVVGYQEAVIKSFQDCLRNGTPIDIEFPIICDSLYWYIMRGGRGEKPGTLYGILFSTTELKKLKTELENEKDSIVRNLSAKNDFLAKLTVEVRQPLQSMLTILELLFMIPSDKEIKSLLTLCRESFDKLNELINDALDISLIDIGHFSIVNESFDLLDALEFVIIDARKQISGKELKIYHNFLPTIPALVHGDPHILKRIITNILSNSLKFTEKGKIIIETYEEENGISISISDTGIGIELEKQSKIFESFSRIDTSITRPYGGSGIGLTVVTKLLNLIGGNVMVSSKVGVGSVFKVYFPYENIMCPYFPPRWRNERMQCVFTYTTLISPILKTYCDLYGIEISFYPDLGEYPLAYISIMNTEEDKKKALELKEKNPNAIIVLNVDTEEFDSSDINEDMVVITRPILPSKLRQLLIAGKNKKRIHINNFIMKKEKIPASILLAEENVTSQIIMSKILEKITNSFFIVDSGMAVISTLKNRKFDILILDHDLPDITIPNIVTKIRQGESSDNSISLFIILISPGLSPSEDEAYKEIGINTILTKPLAMKCLKDAINKLMVKV